MDWGMYCCIDQNKFNYIPGKYYKHRDGRLLRFDYWWGDVWYADKFITGILEINCAHNYKSPGWESWEELSYDEVQQIINQRKAEKL